MEAQCFKATAVSAQIKNFQKKYFEVVIVFYTNIGQEKQKPQVQYGHGTEIVAVMSLEKILKHNVASVLLQPLVLHTAPTIYLHKPESKR